MSPRARSGPKGRGWPSTSSGASASCSILLVWCCRLGSWVACRSWLGHGYWVSLDLQTRPPKPVLGRGCEGGFSSEFTHSTEDIDETGILYPVVVLVQHAGTGGASSGCPLSKEELTVTCSLLRRSNSTIAQSLEVLSPYVTFSYWL